MTPGESGYGFDPMRCDKESQRARVHWYPHSHPFFTRVAWTSRFTKHSPRSYMAAIDHPARSNRDNTTIAGGAAATTTNTTTTTTMAGPRIVVLLHLYAHFLVHHSYTFGLHVRDAARGVRALLARHPSALVLVRGPHALTGSTEKMVIGDQHAERARRLVRQEFRGLGHRVMLLDVWDMTVGNENQGVHPDMRTQRAIVRLFLGHVCPP